MNNLGDISKIEIEDVPDCDLLTYSSPCQDISIAGKMAGIEKGSETRSSLLWECERIIRAKKPKYLVMENVKNLVNYTYIDSFNIWLQKLVDLGYNNYWQVLNAVDYGAPQSRERVFCVSILKEYDTGFIFPEKQKRKIILKDILEDERAYYYSRIPVYEDSIDNIIGYVLTKTLVRVVLENDMVELKDILIKPLSFPRSTEINDILMEFKKTHQHFAVILDEYGGTEGVLTMEDILEEIVGEIYDESDSETKPLVKNKDGSYIVDGQMNLEDFCETFDIDYDEIETEYVTIGGYCIELLDDNFAHLHQVIKFKNLTMTVIAIDDKNTIEKLKVVVEKSND